MASIRKRGETFTITAYMGGMMNRAGNARKPRHTARRTV